MKIIDLINNGSILLKISSSTKEEIINELVNELVKAGSVEDKEQFIIDIKKREAQSSTAIGKGIAIPHAKSKAVKKPAIIFARKRQGLDYQSLDGKPSKLFFMIAVPDAELELHLQALAKLCRKLIYPDIKKQLLTKENIEDIKNIFKEME